jgi:hypothetical protein
VEDFAIPIGLFIQERTGRYVPKMGGLAGFPVSGTFPDAFKKVWHY